MSIDKKVTFNAYGEPKVVITLQGWSDVLRFTDRMFGWQCEFGDTARRIHLSIRKRLGAKEHRRVNDHFLGRTSARLTP